MRQRWIGAFVIIFTLAIGGVVQPLIDRTRAATNEPATQNVQGNGLTPSDAGDRTIKIGVGNGGTIGTGEPSGVHPAQYGPVDQSKPLDFSNQPKSVPRNYVGGRLYNVQVLKGYGYGQLIGQMAYYTQALGVQCSYCHNVGNFAYDTPTKKIARTMLIMTGKIQSDYIAGVHHDYPNYAIHGAVGCVTCHRGAPVMEVSNNVVPVQYLDWPAKSAKQAGFVVNSMYSVSRSLGVNCLFCHNSADFVSLRYYPTNQIAHRMWHMVDDINHKYLPPNIEAVTCNTCHHGAKWPSELVLGGEDQSPVQATALHPEVHANPGEHLASGVQ